MERLEVLRERSKDLLTQLRQLKQLKETLGAEACGPAREAVSRPPASPAGNKGRYMEA